MIETSDDCAVPPPQVGGAASAAASLPWLVPASPPELVDALALELEPVELMLEPVVLEPVVLEPVELMLEPVEPEEPVLEPEELVLELDPEVVPELKPDAEPPDDVDAVPVPPSEPASAPSFGKPLDDDPHATMANRRPGRPTMERARMGR